MIQILELFVRSLIGGNRVDGADLKLDFKRGIIYNLSNSLIKINSGS
jgi:hypothetical protein